MSDTEALIPDGDELLDLTSIEATEQEDEQTKQLEAAKELAAIQLDPAWQKIADKMQRDIDNFRTGNFLGDVNQKDYAAVGQKFIVSSLVADHLQGYLDMVTNAARALVDDGKRE